MPTDPIFPAVLHFKRHQYLARQGERQSRIYRLEDGWACSFRQLPDGRRQIVSLTLPGEYCEPQWILDRQAAFPVVALTPLKTRAIQLRDGDEPASRPSGPLLHAILNALNRQSSRIVSLGCKTAIERLSELFCDLFDRLQASKRVVGNAYSMPLTQTDVAEIVGLTAVHVNRVLRELRRKGLVEWTARHVMMPDVDALRKISREL